MIDSFDNLMCFIVGRTRKVIVRRLNDALTAARLPITFDQFVLLYKISAGEGPVSQQDLADLTGKDKSAILRTLTILEKKGLVSRVQDSLDKRKNRLAVTPECERVFDRVLRLFNEVNAGLREGIPDDAYENLIGSLTRIQENANR